MDTGRSLQRNPTRNIMKESQSSSDDVPPRYRTHSWAALGKDLARSAPVEGEQ